ncbi:MAG: peroxidase-related enzyme [Oculatellaceae cyanobacterium bins.114]|nr:peroxidase-related enzyme [Oculatellaceae cyanobacterium bins.114]
MAHISLIEQPSTADPIVSAVYDEIKSELGFGIVPNLFKSMASNPGFLKGNWETFRATVLQGRLPRTLKEMIGVVISQANQSNYALKVHLHGLSALGISETVLQLLVDDFQQCPLPERQKVIIQFGLKAATQPQLLTVTDYQKLRNLGLDEAEIFEIIATANLFTAVNQYTDAIALDIDSL